MLVLRQSGLISIQALMQVIKSSSQADHTGNDMQKNMFVPACMGGPQHIPGDCGLARGLLTKQLA